VRCYRDHGVDHDDDGGVHGDDVDGGGDDDQVLLNLALCSSLNRNFDGVLVVMKPTDLESYMRSEMMMMHHAMIGSRSSSCSSSSSSVVMERKCSDTSVSLPTGHTHSFKSDTSRSSSSISPLPSGTHTTKSSKKSGPVDLSIIAKSSASSSSRSSSSSSKNKESSHTRMLETSSDVLKSMKAVRKKLATIAELVDKLQ